MVDPPLIDPSESVRVRFLIGTTKGKSLHLILTDTHNLDISFVTSPVHAVVLDNPMRRISVSISPGHQTHTSSKPAIKKVCFSKEFCPSPGVPMKANDTM